MSKHLVGRQLPRPFLPSRGLANEPGQRSREKMKREPQRRSVVRSGPPERGRQDKEDMTHARTHLLQRALYVCPGHAVGPRLFDDVEKRDVLLWINRPTI